MNPGGARNQTGEPSGSPGLPPEPLLPQQYSFEGIRDLLYLYEFILKMALIELLHRELMLNLTLT